MHTESVGYGVLQMMRFIDDGIMIIRENLVVDIGVGNKQGVINDKKIGCLSNLSGFVKWACPVHDRFTTKRGAVLILRAQSLPDTGFGWATQADLTPVTGIILKQPHEYFGQCS